REGPWRRPGVRVWGARTTSGDPAWRYVGVRRLCLYVEQSVERGTRWAAFEPNTEATWARVVRAATDFLTGVWRAGGLVGATADEAFFVKCDRATMTQADVDGGRLVCFVGIAPVRPAEYVVFRIAHTTSDARGRLRGARAPSRRSSSERGRAPRDARDCRQGGGCRRPTGDPAHDVRWHNKLWEKQAPSRKTIKYRKSICQTLERLHQFKEVRDSAFHFGDPLKDPDSLIEMYERMRDLRLGDPNQVLRALTEWGERLSHDALAGESKGT
ncbi:MAG: phage tail sheath family protein, partial [Zavarzinella sp.]|nr:phage tail sheath family protein [Zavarzinella sp.]